MSKFCENCGNEMDDNATKCPNCPTVAEEKNEEVVANATVSTEDVNAKSKKGNTNLIVGVGIVAFLLIVAILAGILGMGNSYKKPINNMFKGMQKANLKTYISAFPEFTNMDDYFDQDDMDKMLEGLEDEYGKNIKITYKILDKEKISKDDLESIEKKIKTRYDEKVKVKQGYKLSIKSTIKGKDDYETDTSTMKVYKIDRKWYILSL